MTKDEILELKGLQLDYAYAKVVHGSYAAYEEGDDYVWIHPQVSTAGHLMPTSPTMPLHREPITSFEPRQWYTCGELIHQNKIQLSCAEDSDLWGASKDGYPWTAYAHNDPTTAVIRLLLLMNYCKEET